MAARHPEIIRQIEDGFSLAWDTTEVTDEIRNSMRRIADEQVDLFLAKVGRRRESSSEAAEAPRVHRDTSE
jgi:hypothetical protein